MKNTVKRINIDTTKKLAMVQSNKMKHFVRTAARLYGKIALREQFNFEKITGARSSFEMLEVDIKEVNEQILKLIQELARTIVYLNASARSFRIEAPVLYGAEEMSLLEISQSVINYVEELVADSDYQTLLH